MPTQAQRTEATRTKIVDAATRLFVEQGYDNTSLADIQADVGLSRGALYHHFDNKQAIAEHVFDQISKQAIVSASRLDDGIPRGPTDTLIAGCLRWLREAMVPETAHVLFRLGPDALGWERCRLIEERYSLRVLRHALHRAVLAGELAPPSADLAARSINAVLGELALALVADDDGPETADVDATVRSVILGFAPSADDRTKSPESGVGKPMPPR